MMSFTIPPQDPSSYYGSPRLGSDSGLTPDSRSHPSDFIDNHIRSVSQSRNWQKKKKENNKKTAFFH